MAVKPTRLVDAHIHLFNARYLPLKAIIRNVPIVKLIAGPIARLLYALTDDFDITAPSLIPENEALKTMSTDELIDWFIEKTSYKLEEVVKMDAQSDEIFHHLQESELFIAIEELEKEKQLEETGINTFDSDIFRGTFVERYKEAHSVLSAEVKKLEYQNMFGNPLRWAFKKLSRPDVDAELQEYIDCDGIPVINFLAVMLTNEAKIYRQAISGYGSANLVLQVHYMMDMYASYIDGKTYYPFHPVQTKNMMQLVNNSRGRLLGFTAFNPKNSNAMASFKEGIAAGNIGAKFYPPMGYKPYNDEDLNVRAKVTEFFTYCEDKQIPIFTHCTPVGFQAKKGWGLYSDPYYWRKALEIYPKLRICFGHAGGGDPKVNGFDFYGWYSTPEQWLHNDCYARQVVELCEEYENAYCEVAHLEKIIDNTSYRQHFTTNLIENFNRQKKYQLKDKICFGTDWHMMGMINEQRNYYEILVNIFQAPELVDNIEKFFSENFISFLNISNFLSTLENNNLTEQSRQYLKTLTD